MESDERLASGVDEVLGDRLVLLLDVLLGLRRCESESFPEFWDCGDDEAVEAPSFFVTSTSTVLQSQGRQGMTERIDRIERQQAHTTTPRLYIKP